MNLYIILNKSKQLQKGEGEQVAFEFLDYPHDFMPKLIIKNPPQYDIAVDKNFKDSIFIDVYKGALENVVSIIKKNEEIPGLISEDEADFCHQTVNTTIAFVGGRGTGKSSAMYNFGNYLTNIDTCSSECISSQYLDYLNNSKFYTLPMIDSSQISQFESVIGRMSAAMYQVYKNKKDHLTVEQKKTFTQCAREVNEIAVMIRDSRNWFKIGDKLLTDTERIGNMQKLVRRLVKTFLEIVNGHSDKKTYLVLSIDDLDMGIENAYPIMEEIRKYLSIPQVIVLVSIDNHLLDEVMYASIQKSLDISDMEISSKRLIKDLSYRYLEKLFPVNRRHHMPVLNLKQLKEWKSGSFVNEEDDVWAALNYQTQDDQNSTPSILDATLHLIWRKTMMIPVCNRDGDHLLIPRNLRSLCNMVVFLRNMPDIAYDEVGQLRQYESFESDSDLREALRRNLDLFGSYVSSNIRAHGAPHLSTDSEIRMASVLESIIHQLPTISLARMNSLIVSDILYSIRQLSDPRDIYYLVFHDVIGKDDVGLDAENLKYCDILSSAIRYPDSVSMGDVMYVLGKIDTRSKCLYIRYLVEVIRTLWSIRMTDEFYVSGTIKEKVKGITGISTNLVTKNSEDDSIIGITRDFRGAVGGFFINPDYKPNTTCSNRLYDWIEYTKVKKHIGDELAKLISAYQHSTQAPDKSNNSWRSVRTTGRPYYRIELDNIKKEEQYTWCHPLTAYTNLLFYTRKTAEEKWKIWQEHHRIVLPFYSFDFMYRYYELFHESFRQNNFSNTYRSLSNMFEKKYVRDVCSTMQPYIPQSFYSDNIEEPFVAAGEIIKTCLTPYSPESAIESIIEWLNSVSQYADSIRDDMKIKIEEIEEKGFIIKDDIRNAVNEITEQNFSTTKQEIISWFEMQRPITAT